MIYYTKTAPMAGICTYKGYKSMLVNLSNIYTFLVLEHKSKRTCYIICICINISFHMSIVNMFYFIIIHLCRFMLLLVSEHSSMIWFYHTFMLFRFLIIIFSPKASLNSIVKYNLFVVTLNVYGFAFNSFISYAVYSFIASSPILILLYQMPLFLDILMYPFLLIYCL